MRARTVKSEQVWQSPDGQKTIWEVVLEADGKQYPLKTFSEKVAEVNFEGDVETYVSSKGDRYVKQLPKQQGGFKGQPRDDAAIRAQWALGQSINFLTSTMPADQITMEMIEGYARDLYAAVDRVKVSNS